MTSIAKLKSYLTPDNKKFLFDYGRVFGLRIIQMSLALVTSYILVRALSQEQFGEYHYILGWIGVLTIFTLPGLTDSVMQAVARGKEKTYQAGAKLAFLGSLAAALILAGFGTWFFYQNDIELAAGFYLAAILFPFMHGLAIWKSMRHGQADFDALLKLEGSNSIIVGILLIAGLLILPGYLLLPLCIVMTIPSLLNIFQSVKAWRSVPKNSEIEADNLAYGIKTSAYSILNVLANHIDKILLFNFLSPEALALYMAAQKLTEPVNNVTQDLGAVLAPRFANQEHYTQKLDKAFLIYSLIIGGLIIIFSFSILPPIFVLIFGEQYASALTYCQALMCSLLFGNVASLRFRFIRSRMSLDSVRRVTLGNSLFRILAASICIPLLGIWGAVLSVFLSRIALATQVHFDINKFRQNDLAK